MSMYKNIFVNENDDASASVQIQGIDGEVKSFGATAFSSVEEAIAGVTAEYGNAVIRVASGKYDTYYVVANDGVYSAPSKVIAVDFTGGTVVSGEKEIAIDAPGFDAEEQLSIISELNDNNAATGTIFVAEGEVADTTIVVGMGEANYIAGQSADAVYGADAEEVYTVLNNMLNVDMLADPVVLNVNSDGGEGKYTNYAGAYAYATGNATNSTIVIEKTNTLSGNTFDNNHKNYSKIGVLVKDGATVGNALSKWDMTYKVTVEAGGTITMARPASAGVSNVHLKNALVIGTEGSDKKAYLHFLSDSYQDGDISIRYNGSLTAYNAEITVQDLDAQGSMTLTDTTMTVAGAFATATFFKTTLTNSKVTVGGTFIEGGLSDFSGGSVNQLGNVTMTASSIEFQTGTVNVASTLKIDSASKLTANALTFGKSGKIEITILEGFTGGQIIDITGSGLTAEDIAGKITLKGATDDLSAAVVDGDIFVVGPSADLEFKEEETATLTDKVVAKDITLKNSKELAVEEGIHATDSAKITNAKVEGEKQSTLNGGYDGDKELAAKITAENNIVLQNDGHANVDLDAKTIIIANNSKETLIGNIGTADTEKVIIADGEATADGVTIDDNGVVDGAIQNATITAANIEIGGQEVSKTTINGATEIIADSKLSDSTVNGNISIGYYKASAEQIDLIVSGDKFSHDGNIFVGADDAKHTLTVEAADADLGDIYIRAKGAVNITSKEIVTDYINQKGLVTIDGADMTIREWLIGNTKSADVASTEINDSTITQINNGGITVGYEAPADFSMNDSTLEMTYSGLSVTEGSTFNMTDSTLIAGSVSNNGTFTVSGESTLNIGTLTGGGDFDLLEGTILKDSTVGGDASVVGKVTFRGDNTFNNLYDFGTYYASEYNGANAEIIVEEGASLTLTHTVGNAYGLGYGDKLTVNGSLVDARAVDRSTLTAEDASFYAEKGIRLSTSRGNDAVDGSFFTVNNAYVVVGNSGTFSNSQTNGKFTIDVNNSVFDAAQLYFTESNDVIDMSFENSDIKTAIFMTQDADSVYSLTNSKLVATGSGNDRYNGNGGTLTITGSSVEIQTGSYKNTGTLKLDNSTFSAATVENSGSFTVSGRSTLDIGTATNTDDDATRIQIADGTTLVDSNVGGYINLQGSLTAEGELSIGAIRAGNPVGEEVTNSVISGDKITVSGNGRFQNGTYEINADMHFDQYVYLSYGGTFTITSDLTAGTTPQQSDGAFWINGNVTLKDGASMVATNGGNIIFNNDTDTVLTVEAGAMVSVYDISDYKMAAVLNVSGSVSASHVVSQIGEINVTDGTLSAEYFKNLDINSINLTVTDEKLATLGKDSYIMLEQTTSNGHPYEFDLSGVGVTYKGETYYVGDSITVGDVIYNVVAGDGNDIAIQAQAKTVVIDSTLTTNGFNQFATAGEFFELHDSYEESIKGNPEKIVVNGTNVLDTDKSKYYFYTDSDLSISGGTLDVSNAGRFYFMDTVAANGTAAADADFSDVATVTIEEGATLKGYINLGQAIDNEDVDADGNVTRDGGAANMVVKGTLDHKNIYVTSGSTLTVTETGKVTNYAGGGDNHIRANAKVVVNGTGKDGDVQFATNWWSIRGGEMEFNNTNAKTGTLRLNADNENALVTGDTTASLKVTGSKLAAYSIEVDNADSSFTATGSEVAVTDLLENYGSMSFDNSTVTASRVTNSGVIYVDDSTLNFTKMTETGVGAQLFVNGTTTISGKEIAGDTKLRIGQVDADRDGAADVDANKKAVVTDDNNITLDVDNISITFGNVYNANVGLAKDVAITLTGTYGNGYIFATNSTFDMNGHTLTVNGAFMLDATITDGTLNFNGEGGEAGWSNIVFQNNASTIESDATVNVLTGSAISVYEDLTVKGKFNDNRTSGNAIGVGHADAGGYTDGATLKISGQDAQFTSTKSSMTVYGANTAQGIEASSLIVENGATFALGGKLTNHSSITVDASSSFSAGAIVNNGTFNSDNAGEMIVLGDMTVTGNIQTTDLILKAGAALSAGSITVTNLDLTLGSTLTLTSSAVSTVTGTISVFGEFSPENAEFVLVAQNWNSLGASDIFYDADNNGLIDGDTEKFTIGSSDKDYTFTVDANGNLVMSKTQATASSLFIGDYESGDVETEVVGGKTYVIVNGMRYEVGVSAFKSATEAAAVIDAAKVTEITTGECDHLNAIADNFSNVEKIIIPAGMSIEDDTLAQFTKAHIEIVNDGHLDADVKASGKLTVSNTSFNTLIGSADAAVYELNNSGAVEDYTVMAQNITVNNSGSGTLTDTMLNAGTFGTVNINDDGTGTFTNVDVVADSLNLKDVKELTLDADSEVYSVRMDGDAGILTLDGAKVDTVYGSGYTADGEVIFTDKSGLANTSIEILDTVTLSGGSHEFGGATDNREYYFDNLSMGNAELTWKWNDEQSLEYNIGTTPDNVDDGMIDVTNSADTAKLTFAQTGNYSLDGFDVSAFDALVNINQNAALTLEEATDYFADGAELTVDGALNLNGTGAFTGTGMDFNGSGDINVNTGHTFTADAALDGFNGELTVADDVLLTLDGANDTAATLLGAGDVKANDALTLSQTGAINGFTGNIEANGSTVTLEAVNTTSATFSGNGTLDLQNDQTFEADGALNGLTGTLNNGGFELALDGINAIGATVTGSGNITANADQSFSGDVSAYTGSYTTAANTVTFTDASTLAANMTLNGAGKFVFDSQDANVTVTGDNAATNLCINDNNFTLIGGTYSYITGTTGSVLTIDSNISATEVAVDGLVIKAGDNLTAGKVTASTTVVYIEDTTFAGPAISVTDTGSSFGDIMVSSWSSAFETPFTIVDSSNGQTYNATVVFVKTGSGALGTSITVDDKAELIDGKFVRVYTQDGDLLIGNYEATSNVVYVNSDWSTVSGDVEKWTVSNTNSPEDTDRIIDRDASKTLENAVNIIKADANGKGQIYVVKGDSYIAPAALMNDVNGLKELTITGESFYDFNNAQTQIGLGDVTIDGNVVALTNAGSGKLTLENVSVRGNVYGGAVVNGTAGSNADATSVKLDGGLYISSNIAGGSFVEDGDFSVGATGVEIVNNSGDRMTVSGRVLGGSIVAGANASVTQDSASVKVDVSNGNEITIRGDIYAAGHNTLGGSLTVTNTSVTFTGDAADLVFTGRVSGGAFGGSATVTNSNLIFDDFTGTFKGLVQEFNTITISGDTELEFSRKQTLMGETDFVFDLTERTANDADAMFTVNQFGWTYGDIIVNSGMFVSGDYILASGADFSAVDIYVDDQLFSGSEIEVNGNKYQFVINDNGTADTSDDTLTLTYTNVSGMAVNNGIAKVDSSATVSGNDAFADISEVVLADQADLSMELSGNNLSGLKLTTEDGKTADVTITDTDPTNWNYISGDGLEIGKGISADITGYIVGTSDITIDGEVNMLGGESGSYVFMLGGDLNVSGKLNSGSSTLQIKGGSVATITGEVKAVHTNIWGSGSSQMVIDGGSVVCNNGDGNVSLTVYAGGHDLTLKNGGKLTVSQVNLNQSGAQSDDPTIASTVNVLSGSQINGAIVGGAMNDTITIDVDAVLNGTLNLGDGTADMLNVTGFENIESTGAVALTGKISNVEKFAINGVDDALNNAVKVSDAGTPDTADDIWAKLAQTSDGSLVVAWGNDDQQIADALDAFNQETFEIGKAVIADGTGFDTLTHDEFVEKKNNGTLA